MRSMGLIMAVVAVALVGTMSLAQQCPPPSTVPQPNVGASTPSTAPAGIGAGPATDLTGLTGTAFDQAYIKNMYQLHSTISAFTTQGIEQSTSEDLKGLSGHIRYEQTKQNEKLAYWYQQMGLGRIPVDYNKVDATVATLPMSAGPQFNVSYARTLISLLEQQKQAAQLAIAKATLPGLRDQARLVSDAATNEINALQAWLNANPG